MYSKSQIQHFWVEQIDLIGWLMRTKYLYFQSGKEIPRHDHLCSQELVGKLPFEPVRHR